MEKGRDSQAHPALRESLAVKSFKPQMLIEYLLRARPRLSARDVELGKKWSLAWWGTDK